ncbi:MAG: cell division protein FtsB [Pseudorhodobacter sp.]|nr:cell division protein FtsB [Rhizobacter sp.]
MRFITAGLLLLLALVHAELWFGKGSVPRVMQLQAKLDVQKLSNQAAQRRNDQLVAEVSDLKEGLEMVEEKARSELGMVKPDEILVQISKPQASTPQALKPAR